MLIETVHGVLRGLFLVPFTGQIGANQIGVAVGSLLILLVTVVSLKWIGAVRTRELLFVGLAWTLLTLIFEIGLGYVAGGWERVQMDYDPRQGGLMPIGLFIMLLSPLIAKRLST